MGRPFFSLPRLAGGERAALPVLMYHRVFHEFDPLQADIHTARTMDTQFRTLARWFKVLPLDEAVSLLGEGRLPPRAACITFDDGYRDNHDLAMPLLQKHGLTATFYVASGLLNGGVMFHDTLIETVRHAPTGPLDLGLRDVPKVTLSDMPSRVAALETLVQQIKYLEPDEREGLSERLLAALGKHAPRHLMMDDAHVRAMARAGMSMGGHTSQHHILARLDDTSAWEEIRSNADTLSNLTDQRVTSFAYPNGKPGTDYGPAHVDMVRRAGFLNAVSTRTGMGTRTAPRFELPRFVLNETSAAGVVMRMLRMTAYTVGEGD